MAREKPRDQKGAERGVYFANTWSGCNIMTQRRSWHVVLGLAYILGVLENPAPAQVKEIVVHNFYLPIGSQPQGPLTLGHDGLFYGVTLNGGAGGEGTVYKIDGSGHFTVLHNFGANGTQGRDALAGVILDPAGTIYGITTEGGLGPGAGVVFKLDTAGHYTVLHNFPAFASDGALPTGTLIGDPDGNLYGTTDEGGSAQAGVVFKLDTAGNYSVIYNFTGGSDGDGPSAGVIRDTAGNLYGTTKVVVPTGGCSV